MQLHGLDDGDWLEDAGKPTGTWNRVELFTVNINRDPVVLLGHNLGISKEKECIVGCILYCILECI